MSRRAFVECLARCVRPEELEVVIRRHGIGRSGVFDVWFEREGSLGCYPLCRDLSLEEAQRRAELFRKWAAEAARKGA